MRGPITTFWGKLLMNSDGETVRGSDGAPVGWHPLVDHGADVAACLRGLLEQPVIRRRLARLGGLPDLNPVQCDRLGFLAALHDLGKVNLGFQNKRLPRPPFIAGHVAPVMALFDWDDPLAARIGTALDLEPLSGWLVDEDAFHDFLIATFAHHGEPVPLSGPHDRRLWRVADGLDPVLAVAEIRRLASEWFPSVFTVTEPLPAAAAFRHAYNGFLTLADWLGSDPAHFPFSDELGGDRFRWSLERAGSVLERIGIQSARARSSLGAAPPTFAAVSEHPPRHLQTAMLELPADLAGSIVVLEAETGSGKTEAALAYFLRLFHAGQVDGLYFALPTRTAATQIYGRVVRAMARAFADSDLQPPVTQAVPGYLAVDGLIGERLARFAVSWSDADESEARLPPPHVCWDDEESHRRRWRSWAAENPKRYMAGAVVVGTVDQALLSALAVRHSHLRASALLRHLLVVDEVHASDAYMTRTLEAVLERHLAAGGHALLMSATMGAVARERLLTPGRRPTIPPLPEALTVRYPRLTRAVPGETSTGAPISPASVRRILIETAPIAEDPTTIALQMLRAAAAGARVLAVRNTVGDCVALQVALEAAAEERGVPNLLFRCAGVPAPHHGRFTREDRQALDNALEARLGPGAPAAGCVVAATQTVQQSLDIDADLLYTDLCPMDVLLQRLGRLHRHQRSRPATFHVARAIAVVPRERDLGRYLVDQGEARGPHGIGTVYADLRILEATWRLLECDDAIEVPAMCRDLVERATHPAPLSEIATELGGNWTPHQSRMEGIHYAHRQVAALNLARWDVPFSHPSALFPSSRSERDIRTRLGEDDRIAEFPFPVVGPFGHPVGSLRMPHHQIHRASVEARPENVKAVSGGVEFRFGDRLYRYDRMGLRPTPPPKEQEHA